MVKKPTKAERMEIMKNHKQTPEQIKLESEKWDEAMRKNDFAENAAAAEWWDSKCMNENQSK